MKITVETKSSTNSFTAEANERILYAGLRQGLPLPYECASGTCGQCKAKLLQGSIERVWQDAPGNAFVKSEKNEFLMCQATAKEDCALSVTRMGNPLPENYCLPRLHTATIENLKLISGDVMQVNLSLANAMDFLPGQFCVLSANQIKGPRAYSLAGPTPATALEFLIKRKIDGRMTEWFFSEAQKGSVIQVFGPLGNAVFKKDQDRDLLLIAGSSGLSTSLSIIRAGLERGHFENYRADLFFGVRSAADIFYVRELADFSRTSPNINVTVCLSEENEISEKPDVELDFATGFVHEVVANYRARDPQTTTAFLAGPPPMVDATLRVLLRDCKISPAQIRYDKFS